MESLRDRGPAVTGAMNSLVRWASPFYAVLLALALVAFWPGYLGVPKASLGGWVHFHAATATVWMLMLIAQPWAIRKGWRRFHTAVGRSSLLLFPIVMIGFVGLAHASMQGKSAPEQGVDAYFFYIRVVLVGIFAGTYIMGMINRHRPAIHARYMVCTGLPLIDPVFHRIAQRLMGGADLNYQLFTFGLACGILVLLIFLERHARSGRHVFPAVLALFIAGGVPLAFEFYTWGTPWMLWKSLCARFAALPLT